MKIEFDFNKSILNKWEKFFGCSYDSWTEEQKLEFLSSLVKNQVSTLDQYVQSLSIDNPFENRIRTLENLNFEVIYRGEFFYPNTGFPHNMGILGQDVVMCNKDTGMIYYATSYQDSYSIDETTDVKNSYLYFKIAGMKENNEETEQLLNSSSCIRYSDGSSYHSYNKINPEEILLLLNNCEFVPVWTQDVDFSILNEGDCYDSVGNQLEMSEIEAIQNNKIMQMPEYVQEIVGFQTGKQI